MIKPLSSNHDTKQRKAIPIEINMSCEIYKFAQSANILTCNEFHHWMINCSSYVSRSCHGYQFGFQNVHNATCGCR